MNGKLPWLGMFLAALLAGCNSQNGNPYAPFGPPTIPPPGTTGAAVDPYYSSPFVTPPPAAGTNSSTTTPRIGLGPTSAAGSDGLSWQTPRPGVTLDPTANLVTARGATISRSAIQTPPPAIADNRVRAAEEPIRIVENPTAIAAANSSGSKPPQVLVATPRGSNPTGYVEISQLPKPPNTLAPLTPTSRVRGFIPALPQQNPLPSNALPPPNGRPRFSSSPASSPPNARYDSAVRPVEFQSDDAGGGTGGTIDASAWRRR